MFSNFISLQRQCPSGQISQYLLGWKTFYRSSCTVLHSQDTFLKKFSLGKLVHCIRLDGITYFAFGENIVFPKFRAQKCVWVSNAAYFEKYTKFLCLVFNKILSTQLCIYEALHVSHDQSQQIVAQSMSPIWLIFLQQVGLTKLGINPKFQLKSASRSRDINVTSMRGQITFGAPCRAILFSKFPLSQQR